MSTSEIKQSHEHDNIILFKRDKELAAEHEAKQAEEKKGGILLADEAKQPPQRKAVDPQEMQRIIGAYARLKELNEKTIKSPNDDAEAEGLLQFVTGALLTHAEELFGCWVVCRNEYTPLVTGFTGLLNRALAAIDARNKPAAETPNAK